MLYRLLADIVLIQHAGYVGVRVLGALLVLRWPRIAWIHVPVVLWGAGIEFLGGICPLTPLENYWRRLAGELGTGRLRRALRHVGAVSGRIDPPRTARARRAGAAGQRGDLRVGTLAPAFRADSCDVIVRKRSADRPVEHNRVLQGHQSVCREAPASQGFESLYAPASEEVIRREQQSSQRAVLRLGRRRRVAEMLLRIARPSQ